MKILLGKMSIPLFAHFLIGVFVFYTFEFRKFFYMRVPGHIHASSEIIC